MLEHPDRLVPFLGFALGFLVFNRIAWSDLVEDDDGRVRGDEMHFADAFLKLVGGHLGLVLFTGVFVLFFRVPLRVVGGTPDRVTLPEAAAGGVLFGIALFLLDAVVHLACARYGLELDPEFALALLPRTRAAWTLKLGVAFPLGALAEELWFRGIVLGVLASVSPGEGPLWDATVLVFSAVLFGRSHVGRGSSALVSTTLTGLAFGAAFLVTGSLLLVVVAHYVMNVAISIATRGYYADILRRRESRRPEGS